MHITKAEVDAVKRRWGLLSRDQGALDFKVRPISEAWRWAERRPAYRTAVANVAYIWRDAAPVDRFGPMPRSFAERRFELRGAGLMLPASAPKWAGKGYRIWEGADAAASAGEDPTAVAAWHVLMQIPERLSVSRWRTLVTCFVHQELVAQGAAVAWAIHAVEAAEGGWMIAPHAHLICTARHWRNDWRQGQRNPRWVGDWSRQKATEMAWRRACGAASAVGSTPRR